MDLVRAELGRAPTRIEIELGGALRLMITWTAERGWWYRTPRGEVFYRVGVEADAASVVPDADNVAAWLRLLATGKAET